MDQSYTVETIDGGQVELEEVIDGCMISIDDKELPVRLMSIRLGCFDVVLGMDWLSDNHALIESDTKVITALKAMKCLQKGCLAYAIDEKLEKKVVPDVSVVRDYPEVFSEELPGKPPDRRWNLVVPNI
ncbi:hypothetical protein OSB04_014662 [Centaurea solstitialis]|uniref:Uncharacterized protein n=1 Tax=Centaurea solstitialis TaxID=347529 RepID=A0AA38TFT2_9ASTR|nr:hypothetical protein OSB04_014662 [Centaurea solstitialis]